MIPARKLAIIVVLICLLEAQIHGQTCESKNLKAKCSGWDHFPAFHAKVFTANKLDLSNNVIKTVPDSGLHDFKQLRYINISRCSLESVRIGAFVKQNNFRWIDLSHNKLKTLSRKTFPPKILSTGKIYLHDNPWDCNCRIKWLVDLLQTGGAKDSGSAAVCAAPKSIRGTKLNDLILSEYCVIKECLRCDDAALCINDGTKDTCVCKKGYHGNGEFCADVDECADKSTNDCKKHEICGNYAGSYECVCPSGFKEVDGECKDVDECKPPPVGCGPGQGVCRNTIGSYTCKCHAGLKFVKGRGCIDLNECEEFENPCRDIAHSKCVNVAIRHHGDRGYVCKCEQGYMEVGEACVQMGDATKLYIVAGAASGIFVIGVIIIILIAVLCRRCRKPKEEEGAIMMAPVAMGAPMDFAFMDLPQGEGEGEEEWRDEGAAEEEDEDF